MMDNLREVETGIPFPPSSRDLKEGEGERSHVGHGIYAAKNLTKW